MIIQIAFCIVALLFLFVVFALHWLGAADKAMSRKYAWWPHRMYEERGPCIWVDTGRYVIFEWVGVYTTSWGKKIYYRLK
jgi:hypothetical protein